MSNTATAMGANAGTQSGGSEGGSQTDSVNTESTGSEGEGQGEQQTSVSRINALKSGQAGQKQAGAAGSSVLEQINKLLAESGGLQVTAGGKSHKVQSAKELERYLQRGIPADKVMEEAAKQKAEMAKMNGLLTQLQKGDLNAKTQILEAILGKDALHELSISQARRRFQEEEEQAKLTPRERQMAQELRDAKTKAEQFEQMRKMMAEQQQKAEHSQKVAHFKSQLEGAMAQTLDLLAIPKDARKTMTRAVVLMQPLMKQMIDSGMPLDPQFLADRVREEMSESFNFFTNSLEGEDLLKFLGDGVGKKVRKAILAQLTGAGATKQTQNGALLRSVPTQVSKPAPKQSSRTDNAQWPRGRWVK